MGELIQFRPRSKTENPSRELAPIEQMAMEIMDHTFPYITFGIMNTPTPESLKGLAEFVAPENDPA